jgi:tetratricopeptide (TPR) repeat protein
MRRFPFIGLLASALAILVGSHAAAEPVLLSQSTPRQNQQRVIRKTLVGKPDPAQGAAYGRTLRSAKSLSRQGKYAEALAQLRAFHEQGALDPEYQQLVGTCLRKLGRFDEAAELYRDRADTLAAHGEDPTQMLVELERVYRESQDLDAAFKVCLELHRQGGGVGAWVRDEMESLIQADLLGDQALAPLREEIERRGDAEELRDLYLDALLFLGRYEESLQEAVLLDRQRNANGEVILDRIRWMDQRGVGQETLEAIDAAIAEGLAGNQLQEAHYLRARSLRRLRRHADAAGAFQQAAEIAPEGPLARAVLQERADLLVRDLRDLAEGEAAYLALIENIRSGKDPKKATLLARARVALADCLLRMGRYEDASEVVRQVEEESKEPADREEAAFQQAEIHFYAGQIDEARAGYERVVEEFAGGTRVNDALDRILILKRSAGAEAVPLAALGQIAYQRRVGAPERAREIAHEALEFCNDCAAAEDLLREECLALVELGRLEEAAIQADSLAELHPEGGSAPPVLREVADSMHRRDGPTDEVLRRYEELVIRFPQSHEALEVRNLLRDLRKGPSHEQTKSKEDMG